MNNFNLSIFCVKTFLGIFYFSTFSLHGQSLIISKIFTNPSGKDSPFEFIELIASENIDFSKTPYTVVFTNNGEASLEGWTAGRNATFGFGIDQGIILKGDIGYVGGSSLKINGTKLKTKNYSIHDGDVFGNLSLDGILGNGGTNADGVAIFDLPIKDITKNTVPQDAIFFGDTHGKAVYLNENEGYILPINDFYSGGYFSKKSILIPQPNVDEVLQFTGIYNLTEKKFIEPRIFNNINFKNFNSKSNNISFVENPFFSFNTDTLIFSALPSQISTIQQYTLKNIYSDTGVEIYAPQNFEISLDSEKVFSNYLYVSARSNSASQTIYIKFRPDLAGIYKSIVEHISSNFYKNLYIVGFAGASIPIYKIQGSKNKSLLAGSTLITEGIVTADFQAIDQLKGYFLQDGIGDGNDSTSDGIFVYDHLHPVKIGDHVRITGSVDEYFGSTQLINVTETIFIDSGKQIFPKLLILPTNTLNELEKYEGMFVELNQQMTVISTFNLARYGELILSSSGRQYAPTNYIDFYDSTFSEDNFEKLNNVSFIKKQIETDYLNRIILDDGSDIQNPPLVPYIDPFNHTLRTGSTLQKLSGIMDFNYGQYRIQPIRNNVKIDYQKRPDVPSFDTFDIKVASLNLYNFFNGDGTGAGFPTERGASNMSEFKKQKEKLIKAITQMDADLLGIMEIENDGDGELSAISELVKDLNETSGNLKYNYIKDPKGVYGNTGGDAIKNAIIYNNLNLSPSGLAVGDTSNINNRVTLAQTFTINNKHDKFSLIVNHFKSKNCTKSSHEKDFDLEDGQGCFNETRKMQATQLLSFIEKVKQISNDRDVLSIGDYNANENEDPLILLRKGGLIDLFSKSYSYNFNGYSGSLDHAFVNEEFKPNISGALKWHINSDEPKFLDYNEEYNLPYTYNNDAFRCSDHDPLIIGLKFTDNATQANNQSNDLSNLNISLYPNPARGWVNIKINNNLIDSMCYEVRSILGIKVCEGQIDNTIGYTKINVNFLSPGTYYVSFFNKKNSRNYNTQPLFIENN